MKIKSPPLASIDVSRLIDEARDAELCRNLDLFQDVLSAFWGDIEEDPVVDLPDSATSAEILRLCGVFLSQFGRARGLPDYQLRAQDLLSHSARLFEDAEMPDKAAEAKVGLSNCFWFSGAFNEYDDILKVIEEEFGAEPSRPVSIQIKLNRVIVATWREDREEAGRLLEEIGEVISSCPDLRLRTQYYTLAGIEDCLSGKLERSTSHHEEAVSLAKKINSQMFVAFNLNNLAMTYRAQGKFEKARRTIDESIAIMRSRRDLGWVTHALDTKALIYLDEREYEKSLKVIDESIAIFSQGEDYSGLTEAMWTRCLALLRLDRVSEAVILFSDLKQTAAMQIGEIAVEKFAARFAEEVYPLKHLPLGEEAAALKRGRIVKAMRENRGHVARTARALGLKSQQHLSDMLKNQFPDIYGELNLKRRVRRSPKDLRNSRDSDSPGVTRLIMPENRTYSFGYVLPVEGDPQFFYFPKDLMMEEFDVKADAIVAVIPAPAESLSEGSHVMYIKDGDFRIGSLSYDEMSSLFLVDMDEFTFLSDVQLIGVPVGYCPATERNKQELKFNPLELD